MFAPDPMKCISAVKKLEAIGSLLKENGCDCECGHHPEEHDDDCELCFACRVGMVVGRGVETKAVKLLTHQKLDDAEAWLMHEWRRRFRAEQEGEREDVAPWVEGRTEWLDDRREIATAIRAIRALKVIGTQ